MMPKLRVANPVDEVAVNALFVASYPVLMAQAYAPDMLAAALPGMMHVDPNLLASGRFYVVEHDGQIIGAGGWSASPPGGTPGPAHIRHFATHPDHIGRGVGSLALTRCLTDARDAGVTAMGCFASLNGEGFYAHNGFERVRERTVPLGQAAFPVIEMQRML